MKIVKAQSEITDMKKSIADILSS